MDLQFTKKHKHYLIILLIFIFSFIFGKNINVVTPEQKQFQDLINAQQKAFSGIHSVSTDQNELEVKKLFLIKKGQCGRLLFDLKNLSFKDDSGDSIYENTKIKVLLLNNFEEKQEIGSYKLRGGGFVQNETVDLCANSDYTDLFFQKNEKSRDSSFEISNVSFYPIAIEKHNFVGLASPIEGNTDFSNIIYQSSLDSKDANKTFKFTRHNQLIGQTFTADSDVISSVDLKLGFSGVGGMGNYYLELREVSDQGEKIRLSSNRIAYFGFSKDSADRDLKIEEGIYRIPLVAHLEKGKTYFIGINNGPVKFNILNTLKIYGGNAGSDKKIIFSVKGKTSEKTGGLYLKVHGADYVKAGDEKVLTGAKVLDNGDGTGSYTYEQKGNVSDYLDINQIISAKNTSVFYDNVQGGISAKNDDNNTFIYKINTVYPFTKMKLEAQQPGEGFTNSLVYYSLDNQNWQEIKSDRDKKDTIFSADKNKFQELIQGDGKTTTAYIKVTYDKDDAEEKNASAPQVHLFGLKNLKAIAELNLK